MNHLNCNHRAALSSIAFGHCTFISESSADDGQYLFFVRTLCELQVLQKHCAGKLGRSYSGIMQCNNLVVLEILGSIIFVTAGIVEATALKLDKIAAEHASETALTLATMAHWTLIQNIIFAARCICAGLFPQIEIGV